MYHVYTLFFVELLVIETFFSFFFLYSTRFLVANERILSSSWSMMYEYVIHVIVFLLLSVSLCILATRQKIYTVCVMCIPKKKKSYSINNKFAYISFSRFSNSLIALSQNGGKMSCLLVFTRAQNTTHQIMTSLSFNYYDCIRIIYVSYKLIFLLFSPIVQLSRILFEYRCIFLHKPIENPCRHAVLMAGRILGFVDDR